MDITSSSQWQALAEHLKHDLANHNITDLFNLDQVDDCQRFEKLSFSFEQLMIDFSKQKLTEKTLRLLLGLAESSGLRKAVKSFAAGDNVNSTENRAAMHFALRLNKDDFLILNDEDINLNIQNELQKMSTMVDAINQGDWRGYSGKTITDVVNIGVGGSDLGPLLVSHALAEFKPQDKSSVSVHYASTMDGSQVSSLFARLNPETTLFIIVSKSFSTLDTLANAASAKAWLLNAFDNEAIINKQHFIGISMSSSLMTKWGIHCEHQLKLWDWVGGRFSLWSTVGLSIALNIGMDNFRQLLKGANAIDKHFFSADFESNLPVLLALVGIWNTNFLNVNAQAILPYDERLRYFPDYLTQLEMESNGKSVTHGGEPIKHHSCPILWGEVGPNAQHAFYQLLHQGTRKVTCDFIAPVKHFSHIELEDYKTGHQKSLQQQHSLTLANCFAQSRALMLGSHFEDKMPDDELSKHKKYPGNQTSTTILISELNPYNLGQLIALYEHKVFVIASIWDINPFDQWGVELGKNMAKQTHSELEHNSSVSCFDSSTNGLINHIKCGKNKK